MTYPDEDKSPLSDKDLIDIKKILEDIKSKADGKAEIIVLTQEEISDLKQLIADKKSFGRVVSVLRHALIGVVAVIIAWNVLIKSMGSTIAWMLGFKDGGQ